MWQASRAPLRFASGLGMSRTQPLKTAFLTSPFCTMSLLSSSLRASFVLLLLVGAPRAGHAARLAGPAPCTPIVAKAQAAPATAASSAAGAAEATTVAQEPAAQPTGPAARQLTLQLGPFQLRYAAHPDRPTLLDRLLLGSRVAALARQVASGNGPRLPF